MRRINILLGVFISFAAANLELRAASISITDSTNPVFNDSATWTGTCFQSQSAFSTTSNNNIGVTATSATGSGLSWDQQGVQFPPNPGDPGCYTYDNSDPQNPLLTADSSFYGDFKPGDGLLWSTTNPSDPNDDTAYTGAIEFDFSQAVSGFGTQFQSAFYFAFTAKLEIYNGDTLLGSTTIDGINNGAADGSAAFLGLVSDSANITKAIASIESCVGAGCDTRDFFVNQISLAEQQPVATPEPASFLLLEAGLAGLGLLKIRKIRS
jgi:hypothetical protein